MSPRRRRRTTPKCTYCGRPIRWLGSPSGSWRPFDPQPVDVRDHLAGSYPVMGRKAWDFNDLVAEIQVLRGCDVADAAQEVRDMEWLQLHRCGERIAHLIEQKETSNQ